MKRKKLPRHGKFQIESLSNSRKTVTVLMLLVFCATIKADNNTLELRKDTMVAAAESSGYGQRAPFVTTSITPTDLRCEYLTNPLGIDVKRPRLSWKLKATEQKTRGQAQRAYHILVASSEELLARDRGDLWDSGEIKSDQSNLVIYHGSALSSGMRCIGRYGCAIITECSRPGANQLDGQWDC